MTAFIRAGIHSHPFQIIFVFPDRHIGGCPCYANVTKTKTMTVKKTVKRSGKGMKVVEMNISLLNMDIGQIVDITVNKWFGCESESERGY
jgi:hypothetical protein